MSLFTKHPKQLWVITFGIMWNTFSYYGIQTILVLYVMHVFQLNRMDSYLLYGAYAAFIYTTPLLGGVIADKWIGYKQAIIYGAVFNIIGNIMLFSTHRYLFSLGLATSLVGSGFYKSNMSNLVGSFYGDNNPNKESGYTLYYLAINVGGTLAPLVYGTLVYFVSWNLVFLCNVLMITLGLFFFLFNLKLFSTNDLKSQLVKNSQKITIFIAILSILVLMSLVFYFFNVINLVIGLLFLLSILYIIFLVIFKHAGKTRHHLLSLMGLSFFSTFYYAAGLQVGITITLFIQQKINDGAISFRLPASTFSTLYCLFILILAPFFTAFWNRMKRRNVVFNSIAKLSLGILFAAIGIGFFAAAALTPFMMSCIVIGYMFLSAGELVMAPAVYTAISDLAPNQMKSTMMGSWMLFIALGGYFSSILATITHVFATRVTLFHSIYFTEFAIIAVFTLFIAMIAMSTIPKLTKMMS